jgi:large conductance mechanosensitive channel
MSQEELLQKMLDELKQIKESVAPKPAPPAPEKPKGFMNEFMAFLSKYGIVGLAIAFIIGGEVGKVVSALVADIIMPFVTFFLPGGAWRESTLVLGPIVLAVGDFAGALIDFIVIAIIVFWLMKVVERTPLK